MSGPRPVRPHRWVVLVASAVALTALAACARSEAAPRQRPLHPTRTVQVTIHYSSFHPSTFSFQRGTTVRFIIRNADPIDHEFILGSAAVQHHIEVTAHPAHDGSVPGQISVPAGTTQTTVYTFGKVGTVLLGCHVRGHYAYGMRGSVSVT
jgi:uncharacterized cupredoxin-like copper-binding protein